MRQRKSLDRQAVFHLISKLEDMIDKGGVFFPNEGQYLDLINYYEGEYLFDRALEVIDFAILQYSLSLEFYLRRAELLLQASQSEQALATLDKVDMLAPGCLTSSLLRAEGLAALDMHEEAFNLLDELETDATSEELSRIYELKGLIHHHLKEYEQEFILLKAALLEDPTNNEALSRMWYCVETARKHKESVKLHQHIINQTPYSTLAWYNLGASQQYLANHEEAIEAYEYAFLTNPSFTFAYRACAEVCMDIKNYQKALECYQELLEQSEPDDDLFLQIGKCYQNLKNYPVALTFLEQAIAFNALNDEALYQIGVCYAAQKKWKKAIEAYLKAIRTNELDENYFAALGEAFFQTGNYKDAEIHLKAAADIAPEMADYWIRLARFYMDTQRIEEALNVLDEAEEYTFGSEILYYRSAFLFKMGKKREALLVLEEALCEDFYAHGSMFSLLPMMAKDSEVKAVISIFQPD